MKPLTHVLCIALAFASLPALADPFDSWLASNAIPLRTLSVTDEDFGDLEPLMAAIGDARVVMLGEPSHGAGSAFAAKARLVRFFHQRMGFDVLAWESGLFDVRLAQAALADASLDPSKAAQAGILPVWSRAAEVRPVFEYARATLATSRPLELVGFDINASAPKTNEKLATEMRAFFTAVREPALRDGGEKLADELIAAFKRVQARDEPKPGQGDLDNLHRAAEQLDALLVQRRIDFMQVHAMRDVELMQHLVANLESAGTNAWHRRCCEAPNGDAAIQLQTAEWNRRDLSLATNLRWLLEKRYAGRKAVVWAHNAHLMRAYFAADWNGVHAKPQRNGMTPMGAIVAQWLKDDVYTIALTTYEGEEAWANGQKRGTISPAPAGSLEARLHALGEPHLFIDLRQARGVRSHPLRRPTTLRISGYGQPTGKYGNESVADITQAFDGVLFIDRMAPATRLPD
ncbi:MAG TPA: erythromycin esterase family protein [Steroidobacteraceae bacterium]|nr:erythromycin esterase family protein [Steroidobacteraceae bacterium]